MMVITIIIYVIIGIIYTTILFKRYPEELKELTTTSIFDPSFLIKFLFVTSTFLYPIIIIDFLHGKLKDLKLYFVFILIKIKVKYIIFRALLRNKFK